MDSNRLILIILASVSLLLIAPKLYYDCHGHLHGEKNNSGNSKVGSQ